jgi:hypothetical protein
VRFAGLRTNIKNIPENGDVPSSKPGPVNQQNDASANGEVSK